MIAGGSLARESEARTFFSFAVISRAPGWRSAATSVTRRSARSSAVPAFSAMATGALPFQPQCALTGFFAVDFAMLATAASMAGRS